MKPNYIIEKIVSSFAGVTPKTTWGETSLFYNPGNQLPNGVYFCTIKEKNGDNDKSSNLDREGIFRLSLGISKESYNKRFGPSPKRPSKGCIVDTGHNFTETNIFMPHPIYAWMSWIQVLNPTEITFSSALPLLTEAHSNAVIKFNKKIVAIKEAINR